MCQECNFTRSGAGKGTREAAGRVEKAAAAESAATSATAAGAVVELAATEATAAVATAAALNLFSFQNLRCGKQDQAVLRAAGGGLPAG